MSLQICSCAPILVVTSHPVPSLFSVSWFPFKPQKQRGQPSLVEFKVSKAEKPQPPTSLLPSCGRLLFKWVLDMGFQPQKEFRIILHRGHRLQAMQENSSGRLFVHLFWSLVQRSHFGSSSSSKHIPFIKRDPRLFRFQAWRL